MPIGHDVTIDGSLSDWLVADRIDDNSLSGYQVFATIDDGDFVFALKAPIGVQIGPNTTVWLNTDGVAATGYQIWDSLGGAEFNVNFAADGTVNLYSGDAGQMLVLAGLTAAWSADRTIVEFRLPTTTSLSTSPIGNPAAIYTLYDFNDSQFLPIAYASGRQFAVFNTTNITPSPDTRIAIVYSATTAAAAFSPTAYSQLFMSVQSQAMQAGVPFDILTEDDLTDLATLAKYDALVFPSFRNVPQGKVEAIAHTLEQASKLFGVGLITAGEFMTNQPYVPGGPIGGAELAGDPYAQMKLLFDVSRVAGGTGSVTINATDPAGLILDGYANGQIVNSYASIGWNQFASVSGTAQTVATQSIDGGASVAAVLATATGGRNVLFSADGVMADANMLQKAIDYAVNGTTLSVGLQLTRQSGIVAARVDMDQSQERVDVDPLDGSPGIYDKLLPLLTEWKNSYNFVGSFYLNIGNDPAGEQETVWATSLPYYQQILALGNEIGNHSYTHPEDTGLLTAEQIAMQFGTSTTLLNQQLGTIAPGYQISGIALPGMPEQLATSLAIIPYASQYLTGGYAAQGAGYPNAFGFLTPAQQDKIYLAPNTSFDFTLVQFQQPQKTIAEVIAAWNGEFNKLVANGETPVVVWPWHDYGAADFVSGSPLADSPYDRSIFDAWFQNAAAHNVEFVTLADLASRMMALKAATISSTVSGNVITATVTASNAGNMALDVDNQGSLVIKNVAGWYAYDSDSLFLPQSNSGRSFTITMGQAQDDVTHITALPMRADLIDLTGDGRNLAFTLMGEGRLVIDLAALGINQVKVTGATVVSQVGEIWTLDVGAYGLHSVSLYYGVPPVITSNGGGDTAGISMKENLTAVTTVMATDADVGTVLTYSISGGVDQAKFTINSATGALSFLSAPDFEAPGDLGTNNIYDVVVRASDGVFFDEQAIAVTITNVNEPPVIISNGGGASATISLPENTAVVTTVVATDQDAGTTLVYSITGGPDRTLFTIDASIGALAFVTPPNFEAPADHNENNLYSVTVRASDGSSFDEQALSIRVTNQNELPPTITSGGGGDSATVSLGSGIRSVMQVTAIDPDVDTALVYSIVGGADQSRFMINSATGQLNFITAPNVLVPTDMGLNNIYDVVVRASDGTLYDEQAIAVTVTVPNAPPIITSNGGGVSASIKMAENGTAVATVIAKDANAGQVITYSLGAAADGALFSINPATGLLTFKTAPDYEAPTDANSDNRYQVQVLATDNLGAQDSQNLTIVINNVGGMALSAATLGPILIGGNEEDTLRGAGGSERLIGNGGNDILLGAGGSDFIDGGAGNDRITGGLGADGLAGGGGADLFIYTATADSTLVSMDTIMDFVPGTARIDLAAIDANSTAGGNQAFLFRGTEAFTGAGQLRYVVDGNGDATVYGNTDTNISTVEFAVKLVGVSSLSATDLLL